MNTEGKRVAVIGGGASGMMAALEAAKRGLSVTLFEKKEQLGKKLSATGNGHCNFTNAVLNTSHYHTHGEAFLGRFLERFGTLRILEVFSDLSLLYTDRNGYYYPMSNQASSVLSVLSERMKALGVDIRTDSDVTDIRPLSGAGREQSSFSVRACGAEERFDACILCLGSESSVKDRKPFRGYDFLKKLGLRVYPPVPSLVPLYGEGEFLKEWAGVRMKACVRFGEKEETGEIQFTEQGISGIPVFQISREAIEKITAEGSADISLDLLPDETGDFLREALKRAASSKEQAGQKLQDFLKGWIPKKMIFPVLKASGIFSGKRLSELSGDQASPDNDITKLTDTLKHFRFRATGFGDISVSQVTSGGLDLSELTDSFEVKKFPGLFVTGELLDADGLCGGYNLHFAFGSGLIAGQAACGNGEKHDTE